MNRTETNYADRRRHSRIELTDFPRAALAGHGDNLSVRAEILDISLGGARMRIDRMIDPGQRVVEVLINGIVAVAEVVWQSATEVGLRYVENANDAAVRIFEQVLNYAYRGKTHCA